MGKSCSCFSPLLSAACTEGPAARWCRPDGLRAIYMYAARRVFSPTFVKHVNFGSERHFSDIPWNSEISRNSVQKHVFRKIWVRKWFWREIRKFRKILYKNIFSGKFVTENGFSEKFGNFGPKLVFPWNLENFGQECRFSQKGTWILQAFCRFRDPHEIWKISAIPVSFAKIHVGGHASLVLGYESLIVDIGGVNRVADVLKKNRRRASYTLNIT